MSDQCDLCLLGLIILSSLLTGTSGVDDHVFISSGVDVRLSCNNALSDCKSTTWVYSNRFRHSATVGLIDLGIKNEDTERHERLSLESDCSLNIKNVTEEEDYGSYICQHFVNGQKQGTDARVYLHVIHVSVSPSSSSSSSQTEISPGRSVTLFCQLYSEYSCDDWVRYKGVELLWVNQAGVDLKTDSRYQISSDQDRCIVITLTTTLSLVSIIVLNLACPSLTLSSISSSVIGISVAAVAVLLLALLWLICRKTADNKRGTGDSAVKDEDEHKETYETINMSIPPAARADEQTDDVTYSEVTSSNTKPAKSLSDHDTVTYAAIRGREDKPQDEL